MNTTSKGRRGGAWLLSVISGIKAFFGKADTLDTPRQPQHPLALLTGSFPALSCDKAHGTSRRCSQLILSYQWSCDGEFPLSHHTCYRGTTKGQQGKAGLQQELQLQVSSVSCRSCQHRRNAKALEHKPWIPCPQSPCTRAGLVPCSPAEPHQLSFSCFSFRCKKCPKHEELLCSPFAFLHGEISLPTGVEPESPVSNLLFARALAELVVKTR